jgi:hypothetical protein
VEPGTCFGGPCPGSDPRHGPKRRVYPRSTGRSFASQSLHEPG